MATEIERKFLVRDDSWRGAARGSRYYRQGYLATTARCSVRVRIEDGAATLNVKGATPGVTRAEYEYPLPREDALQMLDALCEGGMIEKTRYFVPHGAHTWEVDVFEGENAGLVVAEIELGAEDEAFERPAWVGEEVSDDLRYYNARLARHPYRQWRAG